MLPSPQLLATTHLFTVSVVLPFPACYIVGIISYMTFSFSLLSLSNMHLSHAMSFQGWIAHFPLALNNISLSKNSQFILSPTAGCLGCFRVLAVTSKDAINIQMQVFVWTRVLRSFVQIPRSAVDESYGSNMFSFVRNQPSPEVAVPLCVLASSEGKSPFVYIFTSLWCGPRGGFGNSSRCVLVCHYCFNLHFPDDMWCRASFICHLSIFFGEVSVKAFDPFLIR